MIRIEYEVERVTTSLTWIDGRVNESKLIPIWKIWLIPIVSADEQKSFYGTWYGNRDPISKIVFQTIIPEVAVKFTVGSKHNLTLNLPEEV